MALCPFDGYAHLTTYKIPHDSSSSMFGFLQFPRVGQTSKKHYISDFNHFRYIRIWKTLKKPTILRGSHGIIPTAWFFFKPESSKTWPSKRSRFNRPDIYLDTLIICHHWHRNSPPNNNDSPPASLVPRCSWRDPRSTPRNVHASRTQKSPRHHRGLQSPNLEDLTLWEATASRRQWEIHRLQ